jgi:hypothetical protein
MFKVFSASLIYAAFWTSVASAQVPARVAPPVLALTTDSAGALRPLIGIARAATVGSPLEIGFSVVQSAISPDQGYILATTAEMPWPIRLQLHDGTQSIRAFEGLANITRIAVSPTGSAAAFFSESDARIYSFVNLAQSPSLVGDFDASGLGSLSALAIADDGKTVLLGTSGENNGSVFLLKPSRTPQLVTSISHPSAIQFLVKSDTAIIADNVQNEILWTSDGQVSVIAKAQDGIDSPEALGISRNNQKIFIGNSKSGSITTIEGLANISAPVYCNCTLTGLYPTNTDSVFRITDFSGGPVVLFDGNSAASQIVFVPVATQY